MAEKKCFVNVKEFHHADQKSVMEQIAKDNVCPFCPNNLSIYHREPVFWQNDDWLVTKNDFPYEGSCLHLLLICRYHVEDIQKLDGKAYLTLKQAIDWAICHHKIKGGTFLLRFGEGVYNGASVRHLHAHIIVGKRKKEGKTQSLKVKVGYH